MPFFQQLFDILIGATTVCWYTDTSYFWRVPLACWFRFSSVTERFFMELNTRRIDTSVARSETLNIISGMRYLKLGVCILICSWYICEITTITSGHCQVKTEGGLNASASFVAKANPLNRAPHKRKSELHHALCNMLTNILAPLADGGRNQWPPSGVEPALNLWYEAVGRIRGNLIHWMDKQSKHIAVCNVSMLFILTF